MEEIKEGLQTVFNSDSLDDLFDLSECEIENAEGVEEDGD